MEKKPQADRDRELLAFWLQRRTDAQKALEVANNQIEYLTNFIIRKTIEVDPNE
jgi:hypothetical protein